MALVRWDPRRGIDSRQVQMDRVLDAFFGAGGGNGDARRRWMPAVDLVENEDDFVLRADLPGLTEDDVEVEVTEGVLTVSGERKAEQKKEGEGYYRVERAFGSFSRSLSLPEGVDADKVSAEFDSGVLEVRIPKPEERKPHRVQIGNGSVEGEASEK
jgi:HSP20 family protein